MRLSFLLLTVLALAACALPAAGPVSYSYVPPDTPGGRMCIHQCSEARDYCGEGCNLAERRCLNGVQAQAIKDYDKYAREQFAAREPIDLNPSDFERTQPCTDQKTLCTGDCENHYRMCYKNCGGSVNAAGSVIFP